jgi:hypothetical protein
MAAERGIYVAVFLIWGGPRPTLQAVNFTTEQAVAMIHYAVSRYAAYPVLWSTSGDAPYVQELDKWEAVGDAVVQASRLSDLGASILVTGSTRLALGGADGVALRPCGPVSLKGIAAPVEVYEVDV